VSTRPKTINHEQSEATRRNFHHAICEGVDGVERECPQALGLRDWELFVDGSGDLGEDGLEVLLAVEGDVGVVATVDLFTEVGVIGGWRMLAEHGHGHRGPLWFDGVPPGGVVPGVAQDF